MTTDRKIIIGVDFGTTFSGVAWAESQKPDRIEVLRVWPDHTGRDESSGKVPTKLRYTDGGGFEWGFQISPDAPRDDILEHFKLSVYPPQENLLSTSELYYQCNTGSLTPASSGLDPEHLQEDSRLTKGNLLGQDIDKLVTDYLTGLGTHVMQHLRRRLGDVIMDTTPFQFVLTMPAIWSDRAKQRTVDAFERAMGSRKANLLIAISEPEAAATCVLQRIPRHELKKDDCFIVVDAGGGTVDLISYRIKGHHPSLEVSEAAQGSGGTCGGAFLNDRFEQMLRQTLGQEDGFDNGMVSRSLDKWERIVSRNIAHSRPVGLQLIMAGQASLLHGGFAGSAIYLSGSRA